MEDAHVQKVRHKNHHISRNIYKSIQYFRFPYYWRSYEGLDKKSPWKMRMFKRYSSMVGGGGYDRCIIYIDT